MIKLFNRITLKKKDMDESSVSDSLPAVDFTIGNAELNAIDTHEKINAKIRGLNTKQQEIFNFVHK